MNVYRITCFGFIMALLLSMSIDTAWADRDRDRSGFARMPETRHIDRRYTPDYRYERRHDYPRQSRVVRHLPRDHHRVKYRGASYYFSDGLWYHRSGLYFSIVAPPIGIVVPVLPRLHTTVWFSGAPYYYASGTYYRWYPEERGYLVVEPPRDVEFFEPPDLPAELFVYPRAGQSEELQAQDRYECHRWATDQTGFDPTRPGGNVPAEENAAKRADYNRANKACLEARGYSVQ